MKKILSLLTAITLTASGTTSVISCSSTTKKKENDIKPAQNTCSDIIKLLEGKKITLDSSFINTNTNTKDTRTAIINKIISEALLPQQDGNLLTFGNNTLKAGDNYISVTATNGSDTATQPADQSKQLDVYVNSKTKKMSDVINALEGKKITLDSNFIDKNTNANDTKTAIINQIIEKKYLTRNDTNYLTFGNNTLKAGDNYISVTATNGSDTATQPADQSKQLDVYVNAKKQQTTSKDIVNALEGKKININNSFINTNTNDNKTKTAILNYIISLGFVSQSDSQYISLPSKTLSLGDNYISVSATKDGKTATQPADQSKQLNIYVKTVSKSKLVGYWYGWNSSIPTSKKIALADVTQYDIINVAFMVDTPDHTTLSYNADGDPQGVIDGIKKQHDLGHKVLLSIGGATTEKMNLQNQAKNQEAMDRILQKYKFDGIDIDLEGLHVINNENNSTIIGNILKNEKSKNPNFLIGMAPQFPNLRINCPAGTYKGIIDAIGMNNIDYIWPQLYNQGGDGIDVKESWMNMLDKPKWWITNSTQNDKEKGLFLAGAIYYMYHPGRYPSEQYIQIPAGKLFFGLATDPTATYNHSTYSNKAQLTIAMEDLTKLGVKIGGWMTWAINFDAHFNWRFASWYNELVK